MECPVCKLVNPESAIRCDCGYVLPAKPPEPATRARIDPVTIRNTDRIAGWLILPATALVGGMVLEGRALLIRLADHQPDLHTLLGAGWIGFTMVLASLFFRRHRYAPLVAILHLSLTALAGVGSFLLALNEEDGGTGDALMTMLAALASAGIWIPYFLRSRRVKLTFRN